MLPNRSQLTKSATRANICLASSLSYKQLHVVLQFLYLTFKLDIDLQCSH